MTITDDIVAFGEKLLGVLDRGSFTATYKYAVLLGLLDLALEKTQRSGAPPTSVTTRELAQRVAELYWPHTRPYPERRAILAQNMPQRGKSADSEVLRHIAAFRALHPEVSTPHRARTRFAAQWAALVDDVEWKLVEMPLSRLQFVGVNEDRFLYEIAWRRDDKLSRRAFRRGEISNVISFQPRAAEHMVRLAALMRPLIQREWSALVARFNDLPDAQLEAFLFDTDRAAVARLAEPLRELQRGKCFYCERSVGPKETHVDHFVPWARHPNDAVENLVVAHDSCNNSKSDHLAAARHVERWLVRAREQQSGLARIAVATSWESDDATSLAVARGIYLRLPEGTPLWAAPKSFEKALPQPLASLFA